MSDFEARLRNSLRHNLDPIDATRRLPDDVASKARARRFIMMIGTGMAVVLLGTSTVWTASILSSNPSQLPVAPAPSESPQNARTTHTNEDDGFSITTPEDWSVRWAAPGQSAAMYVSTFDFDLSNGFCGADGPLSILPGDGAFFWLYEIRGFSAPPRPIQFELDESSLASYEGSGCVPTYRIDFSDSGRDFSVHTAFGDQAGQGLRQQVLDSLNSLVVSERASEWTTYRDPEEGYSVTYPSDWNRATEKLQPHVEDPEEILSLGSYELRSGGTECSFGRALEDLGPTDAFVSISESSGDLTSRYMITRPTEFAYDQGYKPEFSECLKDEPVFDDRFIPFRDNDRFFYAYIAVGKSASQETRDEALKTLNSLSFDE